MPTIPETTEGTLGSGPPSAMTPLEVGDHLARLVWESFSDFITERGVDDLLEEALHVDGVPQQNAAEEMLIFLMWAHTRAVQLAYVGRAPAERVRETLDALHRAVFEDMVDNGTPRSQLPLFEQRVSARYAEYHAAAEVSDARLGEVAARHLSGDEHAGEELARALAAEAIRVADPLRDFLEDVDLTG